MQARRGVGSRNVSTGRLWREAAGHAQQHLAPDRCCRVIQPRSFRQRKIVARQAAPPSGVRSRPVLDLTSSPPDVLSGEGQAMKFAAVNFGWSYGVVDKGD